MEGFSAAYSRPTGALLFKWAGIGMLIVVCMFWLMYGLTRLADSQKAQIDSAQKQDYQLWQKAHPGVTNLTFEEWSLARSRKLL